MFNTYCFFIVTVVTRTRFSVTLYVHCRLSSAVTQYRYTSVAIRSLEGWEVTVKLGRGATSCAVVLTALHDSAVTGVRG